MLELTLMWTLLVPQSSPQGTASAATAQTQPSTMPQSQGAINELGEQIVTHFSQTLSRTTLTGWLVLLGGIFAGVIAGKILQTALRNLGQRMKARGWTARGSLFQYASAPASLAVLTLGLALGLQGLVLDDQVRTMTIKFIGLLYVVALAWFLYNLVDILGLAIRRLTADDTILMLIRKTLRIFMLIVFALFVAENFFGANISAWLAGLGLAGLAVSLAAQGPIKNVFGSITVVLDRPFSLGDRIKFDKVTGTVENMGFRSTKLRTMDGHLVTVPNMKIMDDMVENISARPFLRRTMNITITYDTPPELVQRAVEIIRSLLGETFMAQTFDIVQFPPRVFFNEFNADSLNITVNYWYMLNVAGRDWWTYLAQAEEFNLRLLRAFEQAGIEFAFPTQTVVLDDSRRLQTSGGPDARE